MKGGWNEQNKRGECLHGVPVNKFCRDCTKLIQELVDRYYQPALFSGTESDARKKNKTERA